MWLFGGPITPTLFKLLTWGVWHETILPMNSLEVRLEELKKDLDGWKRLFFDCRAREDRIYKALENIVAHEPVENVKPAILALLEKETK